MANFRKNPLFRRASQSVRSAARRQWQQTDAAKVVRIAQGAISQGIGGTYRGGAISKSIGKWGRGEWKDVARSSLMGAEFGGMVREIEKYARSSGTTGRLIAELLKSMGPVGSLISSLVGTGKRQTKGLQGDIDSALSFIEAVAPENLSRRGRKRALQTSKRGRTAEDVADQLEAARALLEANGYEVTPPQGGTSQAPGGRISPKEQGEPRTTDQTGVLPGGQSGTTTRGTTRKVVDLEVAGVRRRFRRDHPIVTKAMVPTPESSNVYAFGYDYDKSSLYVRYQAGGKMGAGPGSLYAYSNVPPRTFLAMLDAGSKGIFIWDHIRIRGTVSGHKHDYRLVAVRNHYVPRKATYTPEGEKFIRREVRVKNITTGKTQTLRSGPTMSASPNRAAPNRATPNRGTL